MCAIQRWPFSSNGLGYCTPKVLPRSGVRATQHEYERFDYLALFAERPQAASKVFRFTVAQIKDMAAEVKPHINRARADTLHGVGATRRVFREPVTNEENRVASVLEHVVNPCVRMDRARATFGGESATVSKQLRVDMANMIDALRGELPALIHANELWSALDTMGLLAGARVLVDTTDTEIQDLVDAYNSHHKLTTMKSLIFVAHDGRLLGVETGFGGAESDSTIFRESAIYQQVHPYLQRGERPFVGDSSFHHPHCWFSLTEPEIKATGSPAARAPYRVYGKEVQLYRARVEHAIGHAKARWGSLKSIPAMNHTDIVDITNMIFLTWLLEARFQRLNYERGESQ